MYVCMFVCVCAPPAPSPSPPLSFCPKKYG